MSKFLQAAAGLTWFVSQGIGVGALFVPHLKSENVHIAVDVIYALLACLLAFAVVGLTRRKAQAGKPIWIPAVVLPAVWILVGLWGAYFWCDNTGQHGPCPDWTKYPVMSALPLSLALAIFFLAYQRGARIFVAAYSLVNIYLTLGVSFMSMMAVTGEWL